jgi:hypothetical protein
MVELFAKFGVVGVRVLRMRTLLLAMVLITGALAACGTQDPHPGRTVATGTVTRQSGKYSITVRPTEFTAGQKVEVTVTVSGPLLYKSGCVIPLQIRVTDTSANDVWNQPYSPPCDEGEAGPPIGWRSLPTGQTATFSDNWQSSAQLGNGTYFVQTTFLVAVTNGAVQPVQLPAVKVRVVSS